MTEQEFKIRWAELCGKNPMIGIRKTKTLNEVIYLLRMDPEYDYNLSVSCGKKWQCIPSVRETFVPVKLLAYKVFDIEFDTDCAEGFEGLVVNPNEVPLIVVLEV